jgi:hypothetical protein
MKVHGRFVNAACSRRRAPAQRVPKYASIAKRHVVQQISCPRPILLVLNREISPELVSGACNQLLHIGVVAIAATHENVTGALLPPSKTKTEMAMTRHDAQHSQNRASAPKPEPKLNLKEERLPHYFPTIKPCPHACEWLYIGARSCSVTAASRQRPFWH